MDNITPCAGILAYKDDMVLLVRHDENSEHMTGVYGIPSGVIQLGESELQTALRKFENETGFRTTKEDLIEIPGIRSATIERKNGPRTFSLKVFVAKKFEGELRSGNAEIPEWVKISELDNLKILGNTKEFTLEGLKWITKSI